MRDTLYIRLAGAGDDAPCEVCLSPAKGLRQRSERSTLAQALNRAAGCRLILLVPAAEVRLTSVSVPAKQPQKILQAAPYALEDQFAEDVETLHFAIGATGADGRTPVAVVSRALMQGWLAPLHARRLSAERVLPDLLALPPPRLGQWQALAEAHQAMVRTGAHSGFTCPSADLAAHLQLSGAPEDQRLAVQATADCAADFSALGARAELRAPALLGLDHLAASLDETQALDLLQGAYARNIGWQAQWRPWRLAATLALLWLTVWLAQSFVAAHRLKTELDRQEEANTARFRGLFPNESRIVDLAVQAEQQLTQLKGGGAASGLFPLLDAARAGLSTENGLLLQSLQFKDGALYLSLTGNDLQALDRLKTWFGSRRDVRLEVQSANSSSIGAQIRLKLTPA